MKRYIPLIVFMAVVLFLWAALTCKNKVQSPVESELFVRGTNFFDSYVAASDYPVYSKVYGTVYFNTDPQDGAIVTLIYEDGEQWQDTTQGGGYYELRLPRSGWYNVRACHLGKYSPRYNFYEKEFSFEQFHIDLCIGSGIPCPLPLHD
jgi:hypothetical protein